MVDKGGMLDRNLEVFTGPPSLKQPPYEVPLSYRQRLEAAIADAQHALGATTEDEFCRGVASALLNLDRVRYEIFQEGLTARPVFRTKKVPL